MRSVPMGALVPVLALSCVAGWPRASAAQAGRAELTGQVRDAGRSRRPRMPGDRHRGGHERGRGRHHGSAGRLQPPLPAAGLPTASPRRPPGFRPSVREGVHLATGERVRIDITLARRRLHGRDHRDRRCLAAADGIEQPRRGHQQPQRDAAAPERTELPAAGGPGTGCGVASGLRVPASQRWSAARQRVPLRRHLGPAAGAGHRAVFPDHRRHPGVPGRHELAPGRVRALQRRRDQPQHEGRKQPAPRRRPSSSSATSV